MSCDVLVQLLMTHMRLQQTVQKQPQLDMRSTAYASVALCCVAGSYGYDVLTCNRVEGPQEIPLAPQLAWPPTVHAPAKVWAKCIAAAAHTLSVVSVAARQTKQALSVLTAARSRMLGMCCTDSNVINNVIEDRVKRLVILCSTAIVWDTAAHSWILWKLTIPSSFVGVQQ